MYCASQIEWSLVRHNRGNKIKGCVKRKRLCVLRGGQKGLEVVTESQYRNKRGFCKILLNSGNFLTVTVLYLLNLAGDVG